MLPIRDDRDNKKRTREDRATRLLVRFPNCRARHLLEEVVGEPDYSAVGTLSFVLLLSQCLCTKVVERNLPTLLPLHKTNCVFLTKGEENCQLPCINLNNTSNTNSIGDIPKHQ